jgi:protein gp37
MADHTHIEWTDATWNPITGCSVVSAGCKHCYAMKLAGTRLQHHPSRAGLTIDTAAGPVWNRQVRLNEEWLDQPLRWRRPRRIFVCAHGDLFHESVPDDWIDRVFAVMALAPQHTFQVLTKRAARMQSYLSDPNVWPRIEVAARRIYRDRTGLQIAGKVLIGPLPHIWLGVSVENQDAANERVPLLLRTPAAVRWISAEPLLGRVDLCEYLGIWWNQTMGCWESTRQRINMAPDGRPGIGWVVAGGESGEGARPMHPEWARSLRRQCEGAGVPFLFKQWGEWAPAPGMIGEPGQILYSAGCVKHTILADGFSMARLGKKAAGRLLDGVLHDAYPVVQAV